MERKKMISILGDSISTLEGYSIPEGAEYYTVYMGYETGVKKPSDTWWGQTIEALDGELLVNDSFSGSTVCILPGIMPESCGCSDKRTSNLGEEGQNPDIILVFMGTNDCGYGFRLFPEDESEKNDFSIFSVAYDRMLGKIKNNYPEAQIICLTLPSGLSEDYEPSTSYLRRKAEYSDVIRKCAEKAGCSVADIYGMEFYRTYDGLHPTADGMKTIANAVTTELRKILNV